MKSKLSTVILLFVLMSQIQGAQPEEGAKFSQSVADTTTRWVATWSTAPYAAGTNTPPAPYLANNTLRQIVRASIGGDTLRIKFSNRTCATPVTMNSVNIAVSTDASTSVIDAATITQLTFNGNASVTMNAYSEVTSDPFAFPLTPGMRLAITIYYGQCNTSADMTFHYGSRTDSYILTGDQTASTDFAGATTVERWYNLSSIDVIAPAKSAAIAVMGNSITDGYGVHGGPNNRWTQFFSDKLLENDSTAHVSVLNLGIGATTVIGSGLSRFQQDALTQPGLRWIIIFYGVNDIGGNRSANDIINAYRSMISQAHVQNIRIYGATITPFKGHSYYSTAHEAVRQEVNQWIRTPGNFDACIDFDKAIRSDSDTTQMAAAYSNDWLHPSAAGYQFLGESVNLNLFLGADTTFDQPDESTIESHYFEAECGPVGSNWDIFADASVSNGHYISVKPGVQSLQTAATGSESVIEFQFTITNDSTYYLYARLNCPTYDDDSFWTQMDSEDYELNNGLVTSGWQWMQLQSYNLSAGEHTLKITYREDGAKLDKLCISNDSTVPVGLGIDAENLCEETGVQDLGQLPDAYRLEQNYPNPFNPVTKITYAVPVSGHVSVKVYNSLGQLVSVLFEGKQQAGRYVNNFDASGLPSGVYVYRLEAGNIFLAKKFVLMR
ncbi:T9SS type A sorting domain-containing protein [candidate division KSB1 bacterium]|nr:T9SS type A sorting domain-containing protein [candidate division KSB1 bacterium]